ncbi:MAG: hypothetical protein AAFZ52_17725 [Bacteroidota bacterium]
MSRSQYFVVRLRCWLRWRELRWERIRQLLRYGSRYNLPLDLLFAVLDILGVCDLYEALGNTLFSSVRPLTPAEIHMLRPIFGDSVPYALIRIDERAWVGPRFANFCYVGFHTINSWGPMSAPTLVHEVVHVWQYTHRGASYIPRALAAQRTQEGYDYGGIEELQHGGQLEDFNYEQQADIIEDAFRLANGFTPQWLRGRGAEVLPAFYRYLQELRASTCVEL